MQDLKALSRLDLSYGRGMTKQGLGSLQFLSNLRSLSLAHCPQLQDSFLRHLQELPLARLDLTKCSGVTPEGISSLQATSRCHISRQTSKPANA